MQVAKAHSKGTWNRPSRLYYNSPASVVIILGVCMQNQQAKQEDWPELFSYNIQEKRDLLAAVQGCCLQYCTITFTKHARLKSCKEHGAAGMECITLCTKRSRGKNCYTVLSNSPRNFSSSKITESFVRT